MYAILFLLSSLASAAISHAEEPSETPAKKVKITITNHNNHQLETTTSNAGTQEKEIKSAHVQQSINRSVGKESEAIISDKNSDGSSQNPPKKNVINVHLRKKRPVIEDDNFVFSNHNDHVMVQNNNQFQSTTASAQISKEPSSLISESGLFGLATNFFVSNKGKIFFTSLGICWIGLLSKLLYLSYVIQTQRTWGVWCNHIPIQGLLHSDQVVLAQALFNDIKRLYAQKNSNFLSPLVYFINDTEAELSQLKQFIRIHEILNTIKLAFVFPKQIETIEIANDRINRLEFLRKLVNNYATEYKVST